MEKEEILSGLVLEMRRGVIVLCVLGQLDEPMYGYSLISKLSKSNVAVEANTLYPLLRRLEGQGLLSSTWETSGSKPRKYYVTTELGAEVCRMLKKHWDNTVNGIEVLWEEKKK